MIVQLAPRFLTWDYVDPARRAFDGACVAQTVRSLGPARCVPVRPNVPRGDLAMTAWSRGEAESWVDAMSYALVQHYGGWTAGWRWSRDEGDFDGGSMLILVRYINIHIEETRRRPADSVGSASK